jgi:hypothetical protein
LLAAEKYRAHPKSFIDWCARLDSELSVVRPFTRKHGFVFKARTWDELAKWESQRLIEEHLQRHQ